VNKPFLHLTFKQQFDFNEVFNANAIAFTITFSIDKSLGQSLSDGRKLLMIAFLTTYCNVLFLFVAH